MKIDYKSLNEDTNCTIKSHFEKYFHSQYAIEAAKYPFLSKSQIKNRTMTILKKKNISLARFKGYEYNSIKKISKLEPSAFKRCKNMEDNQSSKETSAKFSSKKPLVPLKVDFVSNSNNGVLKKNSSGSGEKRRVSFNKELYIRYRTTSEESSSSTLKDKNNQLKKNYNRCLTQKFVRSQRDKFDKLINWSYRSPKITHKNISMKITKESLHAPNSYLDEVPQNKLEEVISNKLEGNKDNDLSTSNESYLEKNALCNWQKNAQNERVDLSKTGTYIETNNDISKEESVGKNVKYTMEEMLKKDQIEFSSNSKKISEEKNIQETLNDSAVSGDSSSDEEILQTRFPVQHDEEDSNPESPATFAYTSDNENSLENDLETKKPLVVQAKTRESVDCKTNGINSEMNEYSWTKDPQEAATDREDYTLLDVDADNSNIETESSSYFQNSIANKNIGLNFDETKDKNEILLKEIEKTGKNEKILDQNAQERNDVSPDIVIEQFFNGSFDISVFKPEKNSTMIASDPIVSKQKHLMEDEHPSSKKKKYKENIHKNINNKEMHNVLDLSDETKQKKINNDNKPVNSMIQLKRRILEKDTENSKKTRMITRKNKNKVTRIISDSLTLKTKSVSENKFSNLNNQHKRINNRSQCNDKEITILNNFDKAEENNKKIKTKSNTRRKNSHKNEEIFIDFSSIITPLKKSRNLRSSSLVASKKIKEIEKLENVYSGEEILIDSDSSCFDSNFKEIEDSFKNIFKDQKPPAKYKAENKLETDKSHQDIMDITSSEGLQICFEKKGRGKGKRTAGNKKKYENKIENILDICHKTANCQLNMDNRTLERDFISDPYQPDFLMEENRDTTEKYLNNEKRKCNRRQGKTDKRTENKLLEYGKNIEKAFTPTKGAKSIMNYGITTRSKKKTWEMLQKELLGETNDAPFSNSIAKTVPLNKLSVGKQSMKDVDVYPSVTQTVSIMDKRNKYDGKYKIQDTENKYLQILTNNMQSNEIVPYKSKSIVEKTLATMERCTAGFITPKENFSQKEWMQNGLEFDDITDEISIDHEAEFHSNMTFVTKENEKYYKSEIVAIVKQSGSIINETPCRNSTKAMYSGEEYKYDFSDAEHLIKKSIITESFSVNDNSEENQNIINQALIPSSNTKQTDPWTRLMKKLNLEQCNNEKKYKAISYEKPKRKSLIYHENLKQYTNAGGEMQPTLDLNKREFYKQGEIEKKVSKQINFDETPIKSNHIAICNGLKVKDYCITYDIEPEKNYKKAELGSVSVAGKIVKKKETKESRERQTKKVKKSPKFKLEVEDGGVKFKRCIRSFSSSSEESVKQKQKSTKQNKKITKNREKLKRQKYRRYLCNMFEKDNSKDNKNETISEEKNSRKYPVKEKNKEKVEKVTNTLIAENDEDLFSISSSDSEQVNEGKGLLFDVFNE